jgi:lipoprotein-anchoring transpeptidase ErfK/SrfK
VCSGKAGFETRPGKYRVLEKDRYHRSSLYGCFVDPQGRVVEYGVPAGSKPPPGLHYEPADMFYYMRIYDAVGMHAGWLPGYPASHGCIRLLEPFAQRLFEATPLGTPVVVTESSAPSGPQGSLSQSRGGGKPGLARAGMAP